MGYGVYGDANGKNSVGVCGVATSLTDGKNYGGYFMAQGMFGRGVYGKSIGEFGWGTTGMAYGEKGRGVYGEAVKEGDYINYGGYFIARGKKGIGIWAKGGAQGYAAWFQGTTKTNVLEITGGSDLSEKFKVRKCNEIMPLRGMVVCIDQENSGDFIVCSKAYDNKVAGIISGAGGIKPGMILGQNDDKTLEDQAIALAGKVYCLADATYGAINPGDLLTTSETIGHAIKVDDYNRAQGAILGKAMSSLHDGKGLVLILVTLQ